MPHEASLIWMIVAGFGLAFIFGALANRLRMPPLVGYLVAGVAVGPFTPGFVADTQLAGQLSEIGVILLMFGVGLHFSLKDLLSVQAVAVPGALLRLVGGTAMGMAMGLLLGWPIGGGLVFGLALSVASTVVLLKALQDRHMVESDRGRIAVGWVIVEDIAMVLALVLIPAFSGLLGGTAQVVHDPFVDLIERLSGLQLNIWMVVGVILIKLLAFIGFMLVVGRRVIPWVLHMTAHTGSRELFRLAVLAIALGVAAGSAYVFGVSLALGAFFAGMILSESELSNRAAQESLPFRDAFAVLFFVSVGMLFDPTILISHPLEILGTLFIILVGKTVLGFFLVLAFRRPVGAALSIAASLAQIGEFSFILAALGLSLGLFPVEAQSYILAGAIISIIVNPLLMYAAEQLRPRLEARFGGTPAIVLPQRVEPGLGPSTSAVTTAAEPEDEQHPTRLSDHIILIGYGRVGTVIADGLLAQGARFVLVEDAENRVKAARALGIEVITGNAATGKALGLANVAGARALLVGIPNAFEAGQVVEQARRVNPGLRIVARAHSDEEDVYLRDLGANEVIMGEREIGLGMVGWASGDVPPAMPFAETPVKPAAAAEVKPEPVIVPPVLNEQSVEPVADMVQLAETPATAIVPADAVVEGEILPPVAPVLDDVVDAEPTEVPAPISVSYTALPSDGGVEDSAEPVAALSDDVLAAMHEALAEGVGETVDIGDGEAGMDEAVEAEPEFGDDALVEVAAAPDVVVVAPEPVIAPPPVVVRPHLPSSTPGQPFASRPVEVAEEPQV